MCPDAPLALLHASASPVQQEILPDIGFVGMSLRLAQQSRTCSHASQLGFQGPAEADGRGLRAGCVLLANSAFVQASLLWITLTPIIFKFNRYCKLRFGEARSALHPIGKPMCTGLLQSDRHMLLWVGKSATTTGTLSVRGPPAWRELGIRFGGLLPSN